MEKEELITKLDAIAESLEDLGYGEHALTIDGVVSSIQGSYPEMDNTEKSLTKD